MSVHTLKKAARAGVSDVSLVSPGALDEQCRVRARIEVLEAELTLLRDELCRTIDQRHSRLSFVPCRTRCGFQTFFISRFSFVRDFVFFLVSFLHYTNIKS